jgi:hypothetical protein
LNREAERAVKLFYLASTAESYQLYCFKSAFKSATQNMPPTNRTAALMKPDQYPDAHHDLIVAPRKENSWRPYYSTATVLHDRLTQARGSLAPAPVTQHPILFRIVDVTKRTRCKNAKYVTNLLPVCPCTQLSFSSFFIYFQCSDLQSVLVPRLAHSTRHQEGHAAVRQVGVPVEDPHTREEQARQQVSTTANLHGDSHPPQQGERAPPPTGGQALGRGVVGPATRKQAKEEILEAPQLAHRHPHACALTDRSDPARPRLAAKATGQDPWLP